MKIINGDLIELAIAGEFDVIVHGCNCHHIMGAGIAAKIKQTFPQAYLADLATPKGSKEKLGTISCVTIPLIVSDLTIVNAYTQFNYGRQGKFIDHQAIASCFRIIKKEFTGKKIAYPRIGAGLGGGNWQAIADTIERELEEEDHTLVNYKK